MRHQPTPSFILSLPLQVNPRQASQLHAHFECARQLYNTLLAEAMKRLKRMKADPAWQAARSIPRSDKPARAQAFARLRTQYGFSEYGLHEAAKRLRTNWLAEHGGVLVGRSGSNPRTCERAGLPAPLRYPRSWSVSARTSCRSTTRVGCLLGGVGSVAGGARTPVIHHRESQFAKHPDEGYQTILAYLRSYLHHSVRDMYIALIEQVRQQCDLVLDGRKPIDELAREAYTHIQALSQ